MTKKVSLDGNDQAQLRLPSKLRLKFEQELEGTTRQSGGKKFEQYFSKDVDTYFAYVKEAIKCTFELRDAKNWFNKQGIDIATWHYKTRHVTYAAAEISEWFSGQLIFTPPLTRWSDLEPFPGKKSPYIYIFGNEQSREKRNMGGPIAIFLLDEKTQELPEGWDGVALAVPHKITKLLQLFPEHQGEGGSINKSHLSRAKRVDPQFIKELSEWMNKVSIERVDELKALNNLMASLKVTLRLLSNKKYKCSLPRSTFLCPAYVAGEEVGGTAFACDGFISREAAIIGDTVSTFILSYLRLREDALAHEFVEERALLDQAKNFFIHRLAHDFRHPIDALQSTVRDLIKSLTSIDRQIAHVSGMLDDTILAVDGHDPRKILKAHRSPDRVSEFLADVRFFFKRRIEESGKHMYVEPVDPTWIFNIDRGMLHEIMDNLIANAIEHGGQNIKIDVEKKNGKYLLHVKDDGPGVPAKNRENIFRPFGKILNSVREGPSRGRGLAISKMLAEAHKGDLRLGNRDSKWKADFVIEIPEK